MDYVYYSENLNWAAQNLRVGRGLEIAVLHQKKLVLIIRYFCDSFGFDSNVCSVVLKANCKSLSNILEICGCFSTFINLMFFRLVSMT